MEDIERIKERLDNISSVEPIITSLHTIATSSWRLALRRMKSASRYVRTLEEILFSLLPHMASRSLEQAHIVPSYEGSRQPLMLVVASERGLCGAFNDTVLSEAETLVLQQQEDSDRVHVATFGRRAEIYFQNRGYELFAAYPMPVTTVASFDMIRGIGKALLDSLDEEEIDAIHVIHSPYKPALTLKSVSRRWLPLDRTMLPGDSTAWAEPIIETDREELFRYTIREWIFCRLFELFMESTASEQSARFRAMDLASNNLERIIAELTLHYHSARQHAITMEMLDLVAGSGILRGSQ